MKTKIDSSAFSSQNMSIGAIERAVENWLTNAGERSSQAAVCHLLNAMGYTVVHSTTHGPSEEGKDIIAFDQDGKPIAFQLTQGNVTKSTWHEYKSKIDELVELPIRHPSFRKYGKHRAVFVTNGNIHEHVFSVIDGQNYHWKRRRHGQLETWTGAQLLRHFQTHTGRFLPQPITDYHRLLGFMIADGRAPLDKVEFDLLLQSILPIASSAPRNNAELKRAICAAPVIVEYALAGADRAGNHFVRIEAYTMLAMHILGTAHKFKLKENAWSPTLSLIETALDRTMEAVFNEAEKMTVFGQLDPMTDQGVAGYRASIVAGLLAGYAMWQRLGGRSGWAPNEDRIVTAIRRQCERSRIASEAFVPALSLAAEYLSRTNEFKFGEVLFTDLLRASIIRKSRSNQWAPLWTPYLPLDKAVSRDLGEPVAEDDEDTWEKTTYTLWALILLAVKKQMRQELALHWKNITEMSFGEMLTRRSHEIVMWKQKVGKIRYRRVPHPTKWSALVKETKRTKLPEPFTTANRHWLPFFVLVYPHRYSGRFAMSLASELAKSWVAS